MAISMERADSLARYKKEKLPNDCIENAMLCEQYSDELYISSWDDAIFWMKKAIEIRENLYGKNSIENIAQYERLAWIYADKPSPAAALKWYQKALKIREKALGKNDSSLVPDYLAIAGVYLNKGEYGQSVEYITHAKEIEEKNRPADNLVSYQVYEKLAYYYGMRYFEGYQPGAPTPVQPQDDILMEKELLEKMVGSAVKEYGEESCEAVACIEKYIHNVKMPAQERLKLAGKILKIYYERYDEFEKRKKSTEIINNTCSRIPADIWFSWMGGGWFPWDGDSKFDGDRSGIGWGIKWIQQNVSSEISEWLIKKFNGNDQKMILDIIALDEMKLPIR